MITHEMIMAVGVELLASDAAKNAFEISGGIYSFLVVTFCLWCVFNTIFSAVKQG